MPTSNLLPITNFVNVTIATPPVGIADYQVNNLLYCTKEVPAVSGGIGLFGVYLSPQAVAEDWGINSECYAAAVAVFSQAPNILSGNGSFIVHPMAGGDTLSGAITTMNAAIFFGGVLFGGYAPNDAEVLAAANTMQSLGRMQFVSDYLVASVLSSGLIFDIQAATLNLGRCMLYTISAYASRIAMAAYASRLMSVDFTGSLTTNTMQAKTLIGIAPDPGITQTILGECETAGADVYAFFGGPGGVAKVFSTGGNDFSDNQYNLMALRFALQVAGFNAIATTSTKIPQTEPGMQVLKGEYIKVLQQFVTNGFIAPGAWNSPELFGDPDSLISNVLQNGWYIYSQPINQQSQTARAARQAPLVQIAIKFAGAVHSSNVPVSVNA